MDKKNMKDMNQAEVAVRSYCLFLGKYALDDSAFVLPTWYSAARKSFTKEEMSQMVKEDQTPAVFGNIFNDKGELI